jgi:hypothetical protein
MAEKLSRDEWKGEIRKAASDAADAYVKWVKSNSAAAPAPGLKERVMGDMESFLSKKYPYDSITNDDIETMANFPSDDLWKWEVHGDSYDPRRKHEAEELTKFMPFLQGVAPEGESWLDNRQDMKLKAAEMGFDYSQEGLGKFLDKLAKYQGVYDRGQLMKELRSQPWYWPTRIAYPSMMEGVENAISTGSDFTGKQLAGLMGMDAGTNVAMFGLPGMSGMKVSDPIAAGILDAAGQGALELHRQYAKSDIDPTLEADPAQALAAMAFGATRPGIIGSTQAAVAKIPGKGPMNFSRGIGKATRAGNPVADERDAIAELVKAHNRVIENNYARLGTAGATPVFDEAGKMVGTVPSAGKLSGVSVADTERMLGAAKVPEMAKLLGVKPKPSGRYDVDEFMKAYDRKPVYTWDITHNTAKVAEPLAGKADDRILPMSQRILRYLTEPEKGWQSTETLFELGPKNVQQYKAMFPAKYADEAGASKARTFGLAAGKILGDFGGRFEPTFKLNPLNIGPQTTKKYNEQDWYTRLGPKARAIIDEAFKKKLEEEEEKADLDGAMGL